MKKIFLFFSALCIALCVSAADGRKEVQKVYFTGFQPTVCVQSGTVMGNDVRNTIGALFNTPAGAQYYAQVSESLPTLHKYNSSTELYDQIHDGDVITEGTYYCETQVRIDGDNGKVARFPEHAEELTVYVDGTKCYVYGGTVTSEYSVRWFRTPTFEVRNGKCGANLKWSFDIATSTLTITGTGAMYNFTYDSGKKEYSTPWRDFKEIKAVSLPSGMTTSVQVHSSFVMV